MNTSIYTKIQKHSKYTGLTEMDCLLNSTRAIRIASTSLQSYIIYISDRVVLIYLTDVNFH